MRRPFLHAGPGAAVYRVLQFTKLFHTLFLLPVSSSFSLPVSLSLLFSLRRQFDGVKAWASEAGKSGSESWLFHLVESFWTSFLTPQCLSFPICKMGSVNILIMDL